MNKEKLFERCVEKLRSEIDAYSNFWKLKGNVPFNDVKFQLLDNPVLDADGNEIKQEAKDTQPEEAVKGDEEKPSPEKQKEAEDKPKPEQEGEEDEEYK